MKTKIASIGSQVARALSPCIALGFAASLAQAQDATLRGRVTNATTLEGIEGVSVTLEPAVPGAALSAASDTFGFYKRGAVPPAVYTLKVRHPAFLAHDEPLTLGAGAALTRDVALTPANPGVAFFDIFIETHCTRTLMELAGVPLRIDRYNSQHAATPAETWLGTTDAQASFTARGMRAGWYGFRFNDPADGPVRGQYKSFSEPRHLLEKTHAISMNLLPLGQTMTATVSGFDPRGPVPGVKHLPQVYIELTGVQFQPPSMDPKAAPIETMCLPTRTAETTSAGQVVFRELPPLAPPYFLKLTMKRFGYLEKTEYFHADAAGLLPASLEETLEIDPATKLEVNVLAPEYNTINVLQPGPEVKITGLVGSNTEGIVRTLTAAAVLGEPLFPNGTMRVLFEQLLPGRYRVSVDSALGPPEVMGRNHEPTTFSARFTGGDTANVALSETAHQTLGVKAEPVIIRGRIYAAEQRSTLTMGAVALQDPQPYYRGPSYAPRVQSGVMFSESATANFLAAGLNVVSCDTDATGRFEARVLPGLYGFKIPTMTDYWGSNFDWRNVTTGDVLQRGWAYDLDPATVPDFPVGSPYHQLGYPVSSGDEIQLDLYLRKQRYYLRGFVIMDPEIPTYSGRVLAYTDANPAPVPLTVPFSEMAIPGGVATLTGAGSHALTQFGGFDPASNATLDGNAGYQFNLVTPGSHTLTFSHPTLSIALLGGGGTSRTYTFPPLGTPGGAYVAGEIPLSFTNDYGQFFADYIAEDTVRFRLVNNQNELLSERDSPDYFEIADLAPALFAWSGGPGFKMRAGTYTLYLKVDGKWFVSTVAATGVGTVHVFTINIQDAGGAAPSRKYDLEITTVADSDRTHPLGGIHVTLSGGVSTTTEASGKKTIPGPPAGYAPLSAGPPPWFLWAYDATVDTTGATPKVLLTVRMNRGLGVDGTVFVEGFPSSFLADVEVAICNRFGTQLYKVKTDASGYFAPPFGFPFAQKLFLDLNHPGYYPQRIAISPTDGPGSIITTPVALKPFDPPTILGATINRCGTFLPGVSKSGSAPPLENAPGPLVDAPDLKATWTVHTLATVHEIEVPNFDQPSGSNGGTIKKNVTDDVTEVWLVDPRYFVGDPYKDDQTNYPPPISSANQFYELMRDWFGPIQLGLKPNLFHERNSATAAGGPPRDFFATGYLYLWKLPPGEFKPAAVVRTRSGAWAYTIIEHTGTQSYKQLNGYRLPRWAAGIADAIGTTAAVQGLVPEEAEIRFEKFMPEGLIKAFPKFTGTITKDDNDFLVYDYGIDALYRDGIDLPGTGWLAVMPGYEGLEVRGKVGLKLEGDVTGSAGAHGAKLSLTGGVEGTIEKKDIELDTYLPPWLSAAKKAGGLGDIDADLKASGDLTLGGATILANGTPLEVEASLNTSGFVQADVRINITPIVEKLPQVGQMIKAVNAAYEKALVFNLDMGAGIGGAHETKFSTVFPHTMEGGGTVAQQAGDDSPQPLRRHFLGGLESVFDPKKQSLINTRTFALFLSLGLSVDAGGRLGAGGKYELTGNEMRRPDLPGPKAPSLLFTLNNHSDWPLFTRVDGALKGKLTGYLDVWIAKFEKEWVFLNIPIAHVFNTEPVFSLAPIDIVTRTITPAGGVPAIYSGLAPSLMRRLFSSGTYAVAGDTLAFVDLDPLTSSMVLKVAKRTGATSWSTPVTVAAAAGMLRPALAPFGTGWMLVWTQIDAAAGSATPPSTLRSSTSADGVTWSVAGTIASLAGVATDSRLLTLPDGSLGLVFLESDDGPADAALEVKGVRAVAGGWGAVQTFLTNTPLRAWAAAASGGTAPAEIAYVNGSGELNAFTWTGLAATAPVTLAASGVGPSLALTAGPADTFVLAYSRTASGVGLFKKEAPAAWAAFGTPFGGLAHDVALAPTVSGGATRYLAAWSEGGSVAALNCAFIDPAGALAAGPLNVTANPAGAYRSLQVQPHAGLHEATLLALFDNGIGTNELRTFDVSLSAGAINTDRDADAMDDRAELRIVDSNTNDAVHTIDEVLPTADFDGDGFTNAAELAAGTDPTNSSSFPGQRVGVEIVVGECHEFGTVPAKITLYREGSGGPLTVHYALSGSATSGTDYAALPGTLTFAAGEYARDLLISPRGDTLAEGSETVVLTLLPDAAYALGAATNASVTIRDLPMDEWRYANFNAAELATAAISGDLADPEYDQLVNLLEYAFAGLPKVPTAAGVPVPVVLVHPLTLESHLGLIYTRPVGHLDLIYELQLTEDFITWRNGEADTDTVSITPNGDGTETVVVRDKLPFTASNARFLRVKVQRVAMP
jgi:hypothetical protein